MPSPSYIRFEKRIGEVKHLRRLCRHFERLPTHRRVSKIEHDSALCRASVVLLSSHLQGYIEDLVSLVIERFVLDKVERKDLPMKMFYYLSQDKIKLIKEINDIEKLVDAVNDFFSSDGDLWFSPSPIASIPRPEVFSNGFGNPTYKKIRSYFGRIGFENYEGDLKKRLKGQLQIYSNAVDQLVDQRNKIAHGNPIVSSTHADLKSLEDQIVFFCRSTDFVVTRYFRGIGVRFL